MIRFVYSVARIRNIQVGYFQFAKYTQVVCVCVTTWHVASYATQEIASVRKT